MAKTYRKNYRGETQRDGDLHKKCPEKDCNWCVTGRYKRIARRKRRREGKRID